MTGISTYNTQIALVFHIGCQKSDFCSAPGCIQIRTRPACLDSWQRLSQCLGAPHGTNWFSVISHQGECLGQQQHLWCLLSAKIHGSDLSISPGTMDTFSANRGIALRSRPSLPSIQSIFYIQQFVAVFCVRIAQLSCEQVRSLGDFYGTLHIEVRIAPDMGYLVKLLCVLLAFSD